MARALLTTVAAVLLLGLPAAAEAYPGRNGRLAFDVFYALDLPCGDMGFHTGCGGASKVYTVGTHPVPATRSGGRRAVASCDPRED